LRLSRRHATMEGVAPPLALASPDSGPCPMRWHRKIAPAGCLGRPGRVATPRVRPRAPVGPGGPLSAGRSPDEGPGRRPGLPPPTRVSPVRAAAGSARPVGRLGRRAGREDRRRRLPCGDDGRNIGSVGGLAGRDRGILGRSGPALRDRFSRRPAVRGWFPGSGRGCGPRTRRRQRLGRAGQDLRRIERPGAVPGRRALCRRAAVGSLSDRRDHPPCLRDPLLARRGWRTGVSLRGRGLADHGPPG